MNDFITAEEKSPIVGHDGYLREALGIETRGGNFSPVLLSGCAVPCSASYGFTTQHDNQTTLGFRLFRGSSNLVSGDFHIGDFEVIGLPPSPRGKVLFDISFTVVNGAIRLSAIDKSTGRGLQIRRTRFERANQAPPPPRGTPGKLEYPIGIVTLGDPFAVLIESGKPLPSIHSETFGNAVDNQRSVEVSLGQRRPEGVETIAVVKVDDLPPAPKGRLQITVTLTVSEQKALTVKVTVAEKNYVREFGPFPVQ